jgi:hypothetical protein
MDAKDKKDFKIRTRPTKSTSGINLAMKVWLSVKKHYRVLSVFLTLISGVVLFRNDVRKWFLTKEESYKEENFIPGLLIPGSLNSDSLINFELGATDANILSYSIKSLKEGVAVDANLWWVSDGFVVPWELKFKILNNRLHVYAVIRYINNEAIGVINYNKWELKEGTFYSYNANDTFLEVYDPQLYTVFSIKVVDANTVRVLGYSKNDNVFFIINKGVMLYGGFEENKDSIMRHIKEIPRLHDK